MRRLLTLALMIVTALSSGSAEIGADAAAEKSTPAAVSEDEAFEELKATARQRTIRLFSKDPAEQKRKLQAADNRVLVFRQATNFIARFPKSEHSQEARRIAVSMLEDAIAGGRTDVLPVLEKAVAEARNDPAIPVEMKIEFAWSLALARNPDRGAALEDEARALIKSFDYDPYAYTVAMRLTLVRKEAARSFFEEIVTSTNSPPDSRALARGFLKRQSIRDTPLEMSFTAVDGRKIDLAEFRGKAVLIDFWATWCGPCVAEVPEIKKTYDEFHERGFEIFGISLDDDREALESFLKKNQISWPQYFDGKMWQNKFAVEYGIIGVPTMWLVDKSGKVVDLNARNNLRLKVEHLVSGE